MPPTASWHSSERLAPQVTRRSPAARSRIGFKQTSRHLDRFFLKFAAQTANFRMPVFGSCVRVSTLDRAYFPLEGSASGVAALFRSTSGVLLATIYNSRPAIAPTTSRTKRLGVRSSAFVPRTSTLGLVPLS